MNPGETFYIKENKIFSSNKTTFHLISSTIDKNKLLDGEINLSSFLEIYNLLEDLNKDCKKIELSGKIENFNKKKSQIEMLFKKDKSLFKKPEEDDYDFIEKTSQEEIIDQFISSYQENSLIQDLNSLSEVVESKTEIYSKLHSNTKNLQKNILEKIEEVETEKMNFFEENILPIKKQIFESEAKLKLNLKDIETIEQKIEFLSKESVKNKEKILLKKIDLIKFKIQNLNFDNKVLSAKISSLDDEIKAGIKRKIRPLLFILTLGLIYWTKYSTTKHIKNIYSIKQKKNIEKILAYEKKITLTEKRISQFEEKNSEYIKNNIKKQEKYKEQIHNLEIQNEKLESLKSNSENKLEEIKTRYDSLSEKKVPLKKELLNVEKELKIFEDNSPENIQKLIRDIINKKNQEIEKLLSLKKDLEKQKIEIKGEYVLLITKELLTNNK